MGKRIILSLAICAVILGLSPREISWISEHPPEEHTVTLAAVGDVLLTRGIQRRIKEHGLDWPFAEVRESLRSSDIAFCNLECPLTARGIKVSKPICFKADPANIQCLVDAGFDVISLANNHGLDCSRPGLVETMHYLGKMGITYTGAGQDYEEATAPTVLEIKGLRIAFLSSNLLFPESIWFRTDAPGMSLLDIDSLADAVSEVLAEADVVIVSLHWGVEYRKQPLPAQVEAAHKLIDAGADLILGHHPHVTQPVEKYNGGVIAYSLGNFLFDSPYPECRESMILTCRLSRTGVSDLRVVPVRIVDWRPAIVSEQPPVR